MSEAFFSALAETPLVSPAPRQLRVFYNKEDGTVSEILNVSVDTVSEDPYVVITQEHYDRCHNKLSIYKVFDNELKYFPPAHRSWFLEQHELDTNPWIKGRHKSDE